MDFVAGLQNADVVLRIFDPDESQKWLDRVHGGYERKALDQGELVLDLPAL